MQTDSNFYEKYKEDEKGVESGSAGSFILIVGDLIFCCNVGDCRTILSRNGKAIELSED